MYSIKTGFYFSPIDAVTFVSIFTLAGPEIRIVIISRFKAGTGIDRLLARLLEKVAALTLLGKIISVIAPANGVKILAPPGVLSAIYNCAVTVKGEGKKYALLKLKYRAIDITSAFLGKSIPEYWYATPVNEVE